MLLHFTRSESTFSYFEATRAYIERHGKPGAFYSDKFTVFRNARGGKTGNPMTQFGRAMYELNIDTFCANSSPAKGRVERAHLTLQGAASVKQLGGQQTGKSTHARPARSTLHLQHRVRAKTLDRYDICI